MKFHIYVKEKKSRKNYLILNFLAQVTNQYLETRVLVDGKSRLLRIESFGLKSSYI